MTQPERKQRGRPTFFAVVMLVAGSLATMGSSPPSSSVETAGTVIVDPQRPAAHITVTSDGGPEGSSPNLYLNWTATSESGVEPELSVASLGSELPMSGDIPVSEVDLAARNVDLELTVRNIDETGPVTIDWEAISNMEGSDLDLNISADASAGQPSSTITLPAIRSPYGRLRVPFTVFVVEAQFESSSTVSIERTDGERDIDVDAQAFVGGSVLAVEPGTTSIPTDGAECIDGQCVLTVTLAVDDMPALQVEVSDGNGFVTAVAIEPEWEIAWIEVPPLPLLSETIDVSVDVEMPDDPRNLFGDRAVLVARVPDEGDPVTTNPYCLVSVEYVSPDESFTELVNFGSNRPEGRLSTLAGGATTTVDLRLGRTDPDQYCDVDPDNETALEIGVMTVGMSDVLPAKVSLR